MCLVGILVVLLVGLLIGLLVGLLLLPMLLSRGYTSPAVLYAMSKKI